MKEKDALCTHVALKKDRAVQGFLSIYKNRARELWGWLEGQHMDTRAEIALVQASTQMNTLSHSHILAEMNMGTITSHTHRVLGIITQRRYFYVPIATKPNQFQDFD